ncbi:MAG: hypothetical protein JOZ05_07770 [Acetobacteraceae bacterium]|nr:hypothetical protein [Acetobacteraceae bacterium]
MRLLFSGLVAAGLLTSQMAAAQCVRPTENAGLDVAGLKAQLMVTALTCGAEDRYNAFIAKFRPDLLTHEKAAGGYFSRTYGRNSRSRQDDYITQLANSKSQVGLQQGNRFCDRSMSVFDEVMALKDGTELQEYAAGRTTGQPATLVACGNTPERPTRSASRTVTHRRS